MVNTSGRFTRPWITSRCCAGSMSGMPEWLRSKCRPLGVIMPSSRWCGVREAPTPCVAGLGGGGIILPIFSKLDGWP